MENRFTQEDLKLLASMSPVGTWRNIKYTQDQLNNKVPIKYEWITEFEYGCYIMKNIDGLYTLLVDEDRTRNYHSPHKLFQAPYEDLPLYINDPWSVAQLIVKWRIAIGK